MTDRELMQQALDYIVETNKSSSFWLVPASRLNQVTTALRERLAQPEQTEQPARQFPPEGWKLVPIKHGCLHCAAALCDECAPSLKDEPACAHEWKTERRWKHIDMHSLTCWDATVCVKCGKERA